MLSAIECHIRKSLIPSAVRLKPKSYRNWKKNIFLLRFSEIAHASFNFLKSDISILLSQGKGTVCRHARIMICAMVLFDRILHATHKCNLPEGHSGGLHNTDTNDLGIIASMSSFLPSSPPINVQAFFLILYQLP